MNAAAVWVVNGPGLPCGARVLGNGSALGPAAPGKTWLDVCVLGQHLPQMYGNAETRVLTAGDCARLGLCPHCLGWGDTSPAPPGDALAMARGIDQVKNPCPGCGGSGRPAIRVLIRRDDSGTSAQIRPLPHAYVPPPGDASPVMVPGLPAIPVFQAAPGSCLACGAGKDGKGPRGEAVHR